MAINQQQAQITEEKALQNQTEGELNDSDLETVAGGFGSSLDDLFDFDSFFSDMGYPSSYEQSSGYSYGQTEVNGKVVDSYFDSW